MYSLNKIARLALVLAFATMFVASFITPVLAQDAKEGAPAVTAKAPAPVPAPVPVLLEAKAFDGKITPKDMSEKPSDESISFKGGMLFSTYFEAKGYKAIPYTAKQVKGKIVFTAKAKNAADPLLSLEWTGSVIKDKTTTATSLIAAAKQTKEDKIIGEYSVSGIQKVAIPTPGK